MRIHQHAATDLHGEPKITANIRPIFLSKKEGLKIPEHQYSELPRQASNSELRCICMTNNVLKIENCHYSPVCDVIEISVN